ncbi:MAG TPA: DUF1858 domain-containing protein [Candidatus Melainabacteria bacterium]|nr:DUF1858 domain-containing protein [Candidatus Melainabacteria bacterium]
MKITPKTMIPDLLHEYPQARIILDKFGLKGCGGTKGPHETLEYFARAHGLDESFLLSQIQSAVLQPNNVILTEDEKPGFADTIYRPFFLAGLFTILTLGATWGVMLLWRISIGHGFNAASQQEINAHAQAQVYGWMGFFIMGFAYQAFPRFWHYRLVKPFLAAIVFSLMCSGVLLASLSIPFAADHEWAHALATCAAAAELIAVTIFLAHLFTTYKESGKEFEPYIAYVFTALGWFVISSIANLCLTLAAGKNMPSFYLACCLPALRDMQFHGLGITIILGVSLRTLPALFGLPSVSSRQAMVGLVLLTGGVVAEIISLAALQSSPFAGLLTEGAHASILAACFVVCLPFRLWQNFPDKDRVEKFIKAAFAWLFISLLMLLATPLYLQVGALQSSHAYAGAIRHAITVGFISLMIMGYSAKVVPTLNGIDSRTQTGLVWPFILVNTGCFLRVVLQAGTDWDKGLFPLLGISGSLEVIGLLLWAVHLAGILLGAPSDQQLRGPRPARITADSIVSNVLEWFPETEPIFLARGFSAINNPVLRRTVARQVSIARACRLHGVDADAFVSELNRVIENSQ